MIRIEIASTPAYGSWQYWINAETAPAWAAFIVAIAAVVVAVNGNILNKRSTSISLRQEIMRTNSETFGVFEDLRNRIISVRDANEEMIRQKKLHSDVAEASRDILDLDEEIEKLNFLAREDFALVEAKRFASRSVLEKELVRALTIRAQVLAIPSRFEAKISARNNFIALISRDYERRTESSASE